MIKMLKINNNNDFFTSNGYVFCDNCGEYSKYEILSNYQTLSCSCNKKDGNKGYFIQHNKFNLNAEMKFFTVEEKGITIYKKEIINNKVEIKKIETKKISFEDFKKELSIKYEKWVIENKKEILNKHLNYLKKDFNDGYSENKLKSEVEKGILLIEETYPDISNLKHLIIGDLHNRVGYLKIAIEICKKYNLELTILGDYLDREFYGNETFDANLLIKEILENQESVKMNLIIGNHDGWFLKIYSLLKENNFEINEKIEKELKYYFLIWSSKSNGGYETLSFLGISDFETLFEKIIMEDLHINLFEKFIYFLKNLQYNPRLKNFVDFCDLLLNKGVIWKELKSANNEKVLCLHHGVDFDKKTGIVKKEILENLLKEKNKKEFIDYVGGKIRFFTNEQNQKMIKLQYGKNTTFNFLARNYSNLKEKENIYLKSIEYDKIIVGHDNVLPIAKNIFSLDNTIKYTNNMFYSENNKQKKEITILDAIKII